MTRLNILIACTTLTLAGIAVLASSIPAHAGPHCVAGDTTDCILGRHTIRRMRYAYAGERVRIHGSLSVGDGTHVRVYSEFGGPIATEEQPNDPRGGITFVAPWTGDYTITIESSRGLWIDGVSARE